MITLAQLRQKIAAAPAQVVAIEAQWDGDTSGWFINLFAILDRPGREHPSYDDLHLGCLSDGTDIRLFRGSVPPWPEARAATELGRALADELGVPFYFPSPDVPDDQCARWWHRDHAHRCSGCGLALQPVIPSQPWPWPGACEACVARLRASGAVFVYVRIPNAARDVAEFEAQRQAWCALIVGRQLGLVQLLNQLFHGTLWVMLVIHDREAGVEAVLAHLSEHGLREHAEVSVRSTGNPIRVWPPE